MTTKQRNELRRLATFLKNRQTYLGSARHQCGSEHQQQAWDDYDRTALILTELADPKTIKDMPDVEDLAHEAQQEALSSGLSPSMLQRWFQKIQDDTIAAMNSAPQ